MIIRLTIYVGKGLVILKIKLLELYQISIDSVNLIVDLPKRPMFCWHSMLMCLLLTGVLVTQIIVGVIIA